MECRFVSRAGVVLVLALVAPTAFGQATPQPDWVPPAASPTLPPIPPHHQGIEDQAFLAKLQGIYDSSAATLDKRFAQFSSDAKALQSSHALVLNALLGTKSPDALVGCVKSHHAAEDAALSGTLRSDVDKARANLESQRKAVVGTLQRAYPADIFRAQAMSAQYAALATQAAIRAQTLIRASNLP